ncbi:thioesterase II family protein [Streptomyces sp. NPDC013187]|uniref:thioesterase II family protein n=1 Tax=Streptomyces sp. NPDC013187 TaxID=3364865 RepID=UPI00369AA053
MRSEWFRSFVPDSQGTSATGRGLRLICFPHAGGGASAFLRLSREVTPGIEVMAVQYPGRQDRRNEEPPAGIGLLADALADEIRREVTGRYAFFGHSMGAIVAHEVALRLAEREEPGPERLFLSGRGAPSTTPYAHDRLRTDADVLAMVRRLGGTADVVFDDPDVLAMVMPTLRADYRALGSYVWTPRPLLDIPFTVLVGDADPVVPVAAVAGWKEFTTARTDMEVFEGGHFYLDVRTKEVARVLTSALGLDGERSPAVAV